MIPIWCHIIPNHISFALKTQHRNDESDWQGKVLLPTYTFRTILPYGQQKQLQRMDQPILSEPTNNKEVRTQQINHNTVTY